MIGAISEMAALNGFMRTLLCSNYIQDTFGARSSLPFPRFLTRSLDVSANFTVKFVFLF